MKPNIEEIVYAKGDTFTAPEELVKNIADQLERVSPEIEVDWAPVAPKIILSRNELGRYDIQNVVTNKIINDVRLTKQKAVELADMLGAEIEEPYEKPVKFKLDLKKTKVKQDEAVREVTEERISASETQDKTEEGHGGGAEDMG